MTSFSERFAKLKPTGVERPKLEPKHVQVKDDFKGLGFTKREAERTQREIERQEKKTLEKPDELFQDQKLEQFENSIETTMRQIAEEARKVNFDYDESQERAIRGILQNRVSVLIGAAGTGKTTITKMIWELLAKQVKVIDLRTTYFQSEYHDLGGGERETVRKLASEFKGEPELAPAICGSAFTGRASQQFKRAMPEKWWSSISTTHKLLGYAPVFEDIEDYNPVTKEWYTRTRRIFKPSFGQDCKLPYVVYIIDEGSMEPILLYNELVDAMPKNARVLIIGDINQLPPVMGKSVLGYAMRKWPVFELTTIHRQAADNPIIANAHRILQGIRPVPTDQTPMISDNGKYGGAAEFQMHVRRVMKYLFDQGIYQPYRDAIVVANSKEELPLSYQAFNLHFAMMFNPGVVRINIHTGTTHSSYGIGDKVMIHSNIN
ncbi:MAG TPA: AAA family ATPase, partial [Anaerolineales bacterium]|nr:AAA family ATPase [Anaerolineales bacterium]